MPKHVVTAGPSAGKSSVVRELSARGYTIGPEGARIVIDQLVSEGRDVDQFRTEHGQEFQDWVLMTDLRIQQNLPDDETVFMDRSVADNIAYSRLTDREVPDDLWERCKDEYGLVFLLEQIEFEDDYARTEDEQMAHDIHEELRNVYEDLGYRVIDIPLSTVDERADRIEELAVRGPGVIH